MPPFQGLSVDRTSFLGRCPGLICGAPFGAEIRATVFRVALSSVKDTALSKTPKPWHPYSHDFVALFLVDSSIRFGQQWRHQFFKLFNLDQERVVAEDAFEFQIGHVPPHLDERSHDFAALA